jgi:hypothetical protein
MTAPLEISLLTSRSAFAVGEGIVLELEQRVLADLEIEDIELNRDRSRVFVEPRDSGKEMLEFTGGDYVRLHHRSPFIPLGTPFLAPAGSQWSNPLRLLLYSHPLRAGPYLVWLSYRYGSEANETVRTNAVEVEVVPAGLRNVSDRWFGAGERRDQLGSVWVTEDGRWYYQLANKVDPAALTNSVDLNMGDANLIASPVLAHLNDISEMQFDRWMLWAQEDRLGWTKLAYAGRTGEPMSAPHGLSPRAKAFLADPPLQARAGGFRAVVIGADDSGNAAASLMVLDESGTLEQQPLKLPGTLPAYGCVAWPATDDFAHAVLYTANAGDDHVVRTSFENPNIHQKLELQGRLIALVTDQWNGSGTLLAAVAHEEVLRILWWDFAGEAAEGTPGPAYDVKLLAAPPEEFVGLAALNGTRDLALLLRDKNDWSVLAEGHEYWIANVPGADGVPRLVSAPGGLFVVFHLREIGFVFRRVGEAPPPSGI